MMKEEIVGKPPRSDITDQCVAVSMSMGRRGSLAEVENKRDDTPVATKGLVPVDRSYPTVRPRALFQGNGMIRLGEPIGRYQLA